MAFDYFTDAVARPYKLARLKAGAGVTPGDRSTFLSYWDSPVDEWDPRAEVWKPVPAPGAIELGLFGTGDWERISLDEVAGVKKKMREFWVGAI